MPPPAPLRLIAPIVVLTHARGVRQRRRAAVGRARARAGTAAAYAQGQLHRSGSRSRRCTCSAICRACRARSAPTSDGRRQQRDLVGGSGYDVPGRDGRALSLPAALRRRGAGRRSRDSPVRPVAQCTAASPRPLTCDSTASHTRDAALRQLSRINRWLIAGSVAADRRPHRGRRAAPSRAKAPPPRPPAAKHDAAHHSTHPSDAARTGSLPPPAPQSPESAPEAAPESGISPAPRNASSRQNPPRRRNRRPPQESAPPRNRRPRRNPAPSPEAPPAEESSARSSRAAPEMQRQPRLPGGASPPRLGGARARASCCA